MDERAESRSVGNIALQVPWLSVREPLTYKANQLRLLLAAFAYVLIDGIRRVALKKTTLAKAVPNTIRLKILKLGAKVVNSVRRIKLSLPDACPYKELFFKAHAALAPP